MATIKTVTWECSNPYVAEVVNGVVSALNEGYAEIIATTNSGQKSTKCTLVVRYPVWEVRLDKNFAFLPVGKSMKLTATVIPDEAPNKAMTWISNNPVIAEVTDGVITAKTTGDAYITVCTEVGHRLANCALRSVPENYQIMTLTIHQDIREITFFMSGSGAMEINFGGYETWTNKYELSEDFSITRHFYYLDSPPTVSIAGENVESLLCSAIQVINLDVRNNTVLKELDCSINLLKNLDVSNNTELIFLNCSGNQLTRLDVSNNAALTHIDCSDNFLTVEALNALFSTLPSNAESKLIIIDGNSGTNHPDLDISIAESKGWIVQL